MNFFLALMLATAAFGVAAWSEGNAGDVPADVLNKRAMLKAEYRRPSEIPFPADNPYTLDKADLGWTLFFDPRLSGSNAISCASCHNPALAWGDGLNLAWADLLMWDGRKTSLEDQALGAIETPAEMNQNADDLIGKLAARDVDRRRKPRYRVQLSGQLRRLCAGKPELAA